MTVATHLQHDHADDTPQPEPIDVTALAVTIHDDLTTIASGWPATAEPMNATATGPTSGSVPLPSSTIVLRADTTLTLAYWARALLDHLDDQGLDAGLTMAYLVPVPTTDPAALHPWDTLRSAPLYDLADPVDVAIWLRLHTDTLARWDRYGLTMSLELGPLARNIRHIVKPPRRDSVTIGDCPTCLAPVKVRTTARVPVPTTDPTTLHPWTMVPATDPSAWDTIAIPHPCGADWTLAGWHRAIAGTSKPMTAVLIVEQLHARLGTRVAPQTIKTWANRGLISRHGHTKTGHARYDLGEVLAHVVRSQSLRDAPSLAGAS